MQVVIQVGGLEPEVEVAGELAEHGQERHRVGTAGQADDDARSSRQEPLATDGLGDCGGEIRHRGAVGAEEEEEGGSGAGTRTPDTRIMIPLL